MSWNLLLMTSTALQLKFVYMTSFVLLLGQLRDLTSLKKHDFWTRLMDFIFYEHLLVKGQ